MYCGVPIAEPGRVKERSSVSSHSGQPFGRLRLVIRKQLGDAPIHDKRLAKPTEHDVLGLQVPMHDAAAVRIRYRVAGVDEAAQQSPESQVTPTRLRRRTAQVRETVRSPV